MAKIYALSDIHGCYDAMMYSLSAIHLEPSDLLIFLGDYVDGGDKSFRVLNEIMNLEKQYPNQVITLLGNHDEWFCNWLFFYEKNEDFYAINMGFETISSFFETSEFETIIHGSQNFANVSQNLMNLNDILHQKMMELEEVKELFHWLKRKVTEKRYFETKNQIFVHAGIDEEDGKNWKYLTTDGTFTGKYPATTGAFYKDIISGHIHSEEVSNEINDLGKVYWDGYNHFFIDGHTLKSRIVPVLQYDTETYRYTSFNAEKHSWEEIN